MKGGSKPCAVWGRSPLQAEPPASAEARGQDAGWGERGCAQGVQGGNVGRVVRNRTVARVSDLILSITSKHPVVYVTATQ